MTNFKALDNPPANVAVTREGGHAGFMYRVSCTAGGTSETTYSPTNADAIVREHTHA